jgi:Ca2+-binding EF-hand superfamily protein
MNRLFVATLVALVPLTSVAEEGKKTQPAMPAGQSATFESLDTNKDGRISMPEASADPRLVESFSTADKNGDGYLDNAEYDSSVQRQKK